MPSRWFVLENYGSVLWFIIIAGREYVWESRAAKLGRVVNWSWERYAAEGILKVAGKELWLARDSATVLEGWRRDWGHCAVHLTRASSTNDIQLIGDLGNIVATARNFGRNFFWVKPTAPARWRQLSVVVGRLCIVNYKFGAEKIWPEMRGNGHSISYNAKELQNTSGHITFRHKLKSILCWNNSAINW